MHEWPILVEKVKSGEEIVDKSSFLDALVRLVYLNPDLRSLENEACEGHHHIKGAFDYSNTDISNNQLATATMLALNRTKSRF